MRGFFLRAIGAIVIAAIVGTAAPSFATTSQVKPKALPVPFVCTPRTPVPGFLGACAFASPQFVLLIDEAFVPAFYGYALEYGYLAMERGSSDYGRFTYISAFREVGAGTIVGGAGVGVGAEALQYQQRFDGTTYRDTIVGGLASARVSHVGYVGAQAEIFQHADPSHCSNYLYARAFVPVVGGPRVLEPVPCPAPAPGL